MLNNLIKSRDDAYVEYCNTGEVVDLAKYKRAMKLLKQFVEENNIDYQPIDLFDNEPVLINKKKVLDKTVELVYDDSPDLIDNILEGDVL